MEMSVSSDGKVLAYAADQTTGAATRESIALLNLDSPTSPRLLAADPGRSGGVQFMPDGKAVAYPIRENGVGQSLGPAARRFCRTSDTPYYFGSNRSIPLVAGR